MSFDTDRRRRDRALSALIALLSLSVLSGCVSATPEGKTVAAVLDPSAAASTADAGATAQTGEDGLPAQAGGPAAGGYVDPRMVSAASANASGQPGATGMAPPPPGAPDGAAAGGYAMQPTGVAANAQSIFSNSGSVPAYAPAGRIAPALKSVYSSSPAAAEGQAQPMPLQEHSSAGQALPSGTVAPQVQAASDGGATGAPLPATPGTLPMAAALFAGVPKKRGANGLAEPAALSPARQVFDEHHMDEDDDRPSGLMKLASMSGMTRVAPNGLVLQTGHVDVGCLKPELVRRIKQVEAHYGRPAIITSGYRPPKGVTQGSKHYTCEAVDIQIMGVTKWELAQYLRSLPERGGVGTYCHTQSVHMDIGETRDWNWACRRTGTSS